MRDGRVAAMVLGLYVVFIIVAIVVELHIVVDSGTVVLGLVVVIVR